MTNQQGPPLRFKAVNTETGEEYGSSLTEQDTGFYELSFSVDDTKHINLEISQSTGLHDANGAEIFYGDVLYSIEGTMYFEANELYDVRFASDIRAKSRSSGCELYLNNANQGCFIVIGNRWQSRELLDQKAREVMGRE